MGHSVHLIPALLLAAGCVRPPSIVQTAGASAPTRPPTLAECVVAISIDEVGVREVGYNNGTRVNEYQASTGAGPGTKWCGSYIHWVFRECGMVLEPRIEFARAAKWDQKRVWDHSRDDMFWNGQFGHPFERITEDGDQVMLFSASQGRIYHVGTISGEDQDTFWVVNGNTSGGTEGEGDGVYPARWQKDGVYSTARWTQ